MFNHGVVNFLRVMCKDDIVLSLMDVNLAKLEAEA